MNKKRSSNLLNQFFNRKVDPVVSSFVRLSTGAAAQVQTYLNNRSWSRKDLAKRLGKSEPEVSKWLSGGHNLTLKSIAKMEAALEEDILITPLEARQRYERVRYITIDKSQFVDTTPEVSNTVHDTDYQEIANYA